MTSTAHARTAIVAWCLMSAFVGPQAVVAKEPPSLAARLSPADDAMEYWDVTAWFDSGERVFARFLVTNQGPGRRTAAAVGHVIVADGDVRPFQWGRREGAWAFSASGLRLEIAKATLDLSGGAAVLRVKSTKRRIDLRLTIEDVVGESTSIDTFDSYSIAAMAPSAARAELSGRTLTGSGAVTHTWMERPEENLLRRRDDLYARDGDTGFYVSVLTLTDGGQEENLVLDFNGSGISGSGTANVDFSGLLPGSNPDYPVHSTWIGSLAEARWEATLERERLRMNPLDILPQPFRFLLALGGRPQRVWSDARVKVERGKRTAELRGVAVSTFARPVAR